MPNASHRITDSAIRAMTNKLFILNSIDIGTDISLHPKIFVVFNDVSVQDDEQTSTTQNGLQPKKSTKISKELRI